MICAFRRLDVLLHMKWSWVEHDCLNVTSEFCRDWVDVLMCAEQYSFGRIAQRTGVRIRASNGLFLELRRCTPRGRGAAL